MQTRTKWIFAVAVTIMLLLFLVYFGSGLHIRQDSRNALYKILPDDLYARHFRVGQRRYFAHGALYCNSEQAIKAYYDYINAENIIGLSMLIITGKCEYSKNKKTAVVIDTLKGMFVKAQISDTEEPSLLWIPAMELAYEDE